MTATLSLPTVEVYWLDVRRCETALQSAFALLSPDERKRASNYRFDHDRHLYVLVRAALRNCLASYLNVPAAQIKFTYNHAGKPALEEASEDVSFNVSHSGSIGLLAVGFGCCVGIDVEYMRPDLDFHALARQSFSACELSRLSELKGHELVTGFYRCWTRKEAYIKAIGDGISYGLAHFDVSLNAAETRVLTDRNSDSELRWLYSDLPLWPDYTATVVADALDYRIHTKGYRIQTSPL